MGKQGPLGVLAIALAIALGSCGDDNGGEDQTTPVQPAELEIYDWEGSLVTERPFLSESAARGTGGKGAVIVRDPEPEGSARPQYFALRGEPAVTTEDVASAQAEAGPTGEPTVSLELNEGGKRRFEELTRSVASAGGGKPGPVAHIAIVVDGELLSLPVIDPVQIPEGISAEQGIQLSGGFTEAEAEELAERLQG